MGVSFGRRSFLVFLFLSKGVSSAKTEPVASVCTMRSVSHLILADALTLRSCRSPRRLRRPSGGASTGPSERTTADSNFNVTKLVSY